MIESLRRIDYKFTPEDYVASKDKVVAIGTYTGTYKATGKPLTARVWLTSGNQKKKRLSALNSL